MGQVVKLSEYRRAHSFPTEEEAGDSLVPIEFAAGFQNRDECLNKIAEYGIRAIHIRRVKGESDALLYLLGVNDAIWLNKQILEREVIADEEIAKRIDLIQMLENVNFALMDSMWDSFTQQNTF